MLIDKELKTAICDMVSKIIREEVTSKLQNLETKVNELTTMQRQFITCKPRWHGLKPVYIPWTKPLHL